MKKREYLKIVSMFLTLTVGVSLAVSAIVSIFIGLLFVGWHYLGSVSYTHLTLPTKA